LALEGKTLAEALEDQLKKQTAGTTVQVIFTLQGVPQELPPEWEANILRIGQEVLTNVFRHAQASKVNVLLAFDHNEVRLTMRDDGCGFNSDVKSEGFGLRGISERVEKMGGQLSIQGTKGAGTAISVVLPLLSPDEPEKT
jgi:signal transduction histidine kinase